MTSAGIGMKMPDGSIKAVRLNCDGYPGHAGVVLAGWYKTADRVKALLNLGELSFLGERFDSSDPGEGPDREKRLMQKSPGLQLRKLEIRHAGFPGLRTWAERRRVQKHPPAPPETAPWQRRLEERRTGRIRSKKRTTGPQGPIKSKTNERNITP